MYNAAGCIARCVKKHLCPELQKYRDHPAERRLQGRHSLSLPCSCRSGPSHRAGGQAQFRRGGHPQSGACAGPWPLHPVRGQRRLAGPGLYRKARHRRRDPRRRSCDRALLDGVSEGLRGTHPPVGKGAGHRAPAQPAPHPGLRLSARRGVHRAGVRPSADRKAQYLLLRCAVEQALPPGSPCRARHPLPAGAVLQKISCSTPNICAMCALPFPSRTSATITCSAARAFPTPE